MFVLLPVLGSLFSCVRDCSGYPAARHERGVEAESPAPALRGTRPKKRDASFGRLFFYQMLKKMTGLFSNFAWCNELYLAMERFLDRHNTGNFDLIVIGGGITGAALAYEASTRGLKVALFEKSDYGAATSSATSKLIHGGLRYLKNLELGLVRESLRERRILSNIAPNFVHPIPFMIPSFQGLKSHKWPLMAAMVLYDALSYDKGRTWDPAKRLPHFSSCSRAETMALEPCVKTEGLTGSTVYFDCQNIFPERMTLAFLKSAEAFGARLSNYARVVSFLREGERVAGVVVSDELTGREGRFRAPLTVNCAGPWADLVIRPATPDGTKHRIRRSEGIHIVTRKICREHAVTVLTAQNRHLMVMPWRGHSLIGTTDKEYFGHPDDYKVTATAIKQLLGDVNANFRGAGLKYEDVLFYYGGLRPLADTDTGSSYESSRKYEIYDNADEGLPGLFTVEGGKYTTSRQLAVEVLQKASRRLKKKLPAGVSSRRYLAGSRIRDMAAFGEELRSAYPDFSPATLTYLGRNYGTESHAVLQLARKNGKLAEILTDEGEILAEVVYAVRQESAFSLSDVLFRRTGLGTLGHPGNTVLEKVVAAMAEELGWEEQKCRAEKQLVTKRFRLPEEQEAKNQSYG